MRVYFGVLALSPCKSCTREKTSDGNAIRPAKSRWILRTEKARFTTWIFPVGFSKSLLEIYSHVSGSPSRDETYDRSRNGATKEDLFISSIYIYIYSSDCDGAFGKIKLFCEENTGRSFVLFNIALILRLKLLSACPVNERCEGARCIYASR